jgi:hypothetical protein
VSFYVSTAIYFAKYGIDIQIRKYQSEAGNDEIQNVQRENKHGFLFCGNYILKYWYICR